MVLPAGIQHRLVPLVAFASSLDVLGWQRWEFLLAAARPEAAYEELGVGVGLPGHLRQMALHVLFAGVAGRERRPAQRAFHPAM